MPRSKTPRIVYESYIAEPVQESWRDGWRSAYACIAYFADQYDVAREQLEAMNWHPWRNSLEYWELDPEIWPLEIVARTGEHRFRVNEAEVLWKENDRTGAARAYRELLDEELDDSTRQYATVRLAAIKRSL